MGRACSITRCDIFWNAWIAGWMLGGLARPQIRIPYDQTAGI